MAKTKTFLQSVSPERNGWRNRDLPRRILLLNLFSKNSKILRFHSGVKSLLRHCPRNHVIHKDFLKHYKAFHSSTVSASDQRLASCWLQLRRWFDPDEYGLFYHYYYADCFRDDQVTSRDIFVSRAYDECDRSQTCWLKSSYNT